MWSRRGRKRAYCAPPTLKPLFRVPSAGVLLPFAARNPAKVAIGDGPRVGGAAAMIWATRGSFPCARCPGLPSAPSIRRCTSPFGHPTVANLRNSHEPGLHRIARMIVVVPELPWIIHAHADSLIGFYLPPVPDSGMSPPHPLTYHACQRSLHIVQRFLPRDTIPTRPSQASNSLSFRFAPAR